MILGAPSPHRPVSSIGHVDLLRRATLKFGGTDEAGAFLRAPAALAFVAVEDSHEVIGWCWGYHLVRPDASPMLYLHELEVAESHRRQGHGRALLEAFMAAGRSAGAAKMFLSTAEADEPARPLYDSMGVASQPRDQRSTTGFRWLTRRRSEPRAEREPCVGTTVRLPGRRSVRARPVRWRPRCYAEAWLKALLGEPSPVQGRLSFNPGSRLTDGTSSG